MSYRRSRAPAPVQNLYNIDFADKHLALMYPTQTTTYIDGYAWSDDESNRTVPMISSIARGSIVNASDSTYIAESKLWPDVPVAPNHLSCAHCLLENNGNWPPITPFIKMPDPYSQVTNADFELVASDDAFFYDSIDRFYVDFENKAAVSVWVDRMLRHCEDTVRLISPYKKCTHVFFDNGHLNVPEVNSLAEIEALGRLRAKLHQYLGTRLVVNFSANWHSESQDVVLALSECLDGIGLEQPFSSSAKMKFANLQSSIDNYRTLLNSNRWVMAIPTSQSYIAPGAVLNGIVGTVTDTRESSAHQLLYDRFSAAMALVIKPESTSPMFSAYRRDYRPGRYSSSDNIDVSYIDSGEASLNEIPVKDWDNWPELLGAPTSDYTVDVEENALPDTEDHTYYGVDIINISRTFQNGTVSVNVSADLSNDIETRKGGVSVIINTPD